MIQSAHWYHSWPPRMCAGILEKWFILTFYKHIPICRWSIILPLCRRMWILTKYVKLHTVAKLTCLHKNLHVSYSYITVMTSFALFKLKFYTITPFYRKHLYLSILVLTWETKHVLIILTILQWIFYYYCYRSTHFVSILIKQFMDNAWCMYSLLCRRFKVICRHDFV